MSFLNPDLNESELTNGLPEQVNNLNETTVIDPEGRSDPRIHQISDTPDDILSMAQFALDELNCSILATLDDEDMTARELVRRLRVPMTTCYRRLTRLAREGLVKETSRRTRDGNLPFKVYSSQLESLSVHYEGIDFKLALNLNCEPGQNLSYHERVRPTL